MKKDIKIILWGAIGALLLSLIVLVIIHFAFKIPAPCDFFIPQWTASDVLEYFGVILGISVTLVSLIYSNYATNKQQQELQKFQINQELKNKINELCIGILREFSFPKINIAVDNLLAKKNNLNKFLIQEEFNNTFFEIEIFWSSLKYYFPERDDRFKSVGNILAKRLNAISKLEDVFLQGCKITDTGQRFCFINENLVQQYLQECFTYILENTTILAEQLKTVTESVGE